MVATPARLLMKANVFALLRERRLTHKDLAQYCRKTESWISKIHRDPKKGFPLKYLDRIADFVGVEPYQLLQPGMTDMSERRRLQRRRRADRRGVARQALADAAPIPTNGSSHIPPDVLTRRLNEIMLELSALAAGSVDQAPAQTVKKGRK